MIKLICHVKYLNLYYILHCNSVYKCKNVQESKVRMGQVENCFLTMSFFFFKQKSMIVNKYTMAYNRSFIFWLFLEMEYWISAHRSDFSFRIFKARVYRRILNRIILNCSHNPFCYTKHRFQETMTQGIAVHLVIMICLSTATISNIIE